MASIDPTPKPPSHTFHCKACGKPITADLPPPDHCAFSNHPLVSAVIIPHEAVTVCPWCNATYALMLVSFAPSWVFQMVEKKSESGLIIPHAGPIPFRKPGRG